MVTCNFTSFKRLIAVLEGFFGSNDGNDLVMIQYLLQLEMIRIILPHFRQYSTIALEDCLSNLDNNHSIDRLYEALIINNNKYANSII